MNKELTIIEEENIQLKNKIDKLMEIIDKKDIKICELNIKLVRTEKILNDWNEYFKNNK